MSRGPAGRFLLLDVDREIVVAVEDGAAELVPSVVEDPLGAGLLDFVHPVDRTALAEWLDGGLGASPPFRRAAADEPPRWFRFLSVVPSPGRSRSRILMLEVTDEVREDALRRRLNSILARRIGRSLVDDAAAVAAELAGCTHACLAEIQGPLAVIRSSVGKRMLRMGASLPVAGTPLEEAVGLRAPREYPDGVASAFPGWPAFSEIGARFAALVPVVGPGDDSTRAVLLCCAPRPRSLMPVETELLELLATRLASELAAKGETEERSRDLEETALDASEDVLHTLTLAMAVRGMSHTLNNLLAALVLNAELAAEAGGSGGDAGHYLARIAQSARRGGDIVRELVHLGDGASAGHASVSAAASVEQAVALVGRLHEAVRLDLITDGSGAAVWGDERTLLSLIIALLLPMAEAVSPGACLSVDVAEVDGEPDEGPTVAISCSVDPLGSAFGEHEAGMDVDQARMLDLGVSLAARSARYLGGRLTRDWQGYRYTVTVALPAVATTAE